MTNGDFASLEEFDDVESHNIDRLMRARGIPKFLRWRWIKLSSRDNARTTGAVVGEGRRGLYRGETMVETQRELPVDQL